MRKVLFALLTIALVMGLVGGGYFAYFRDTETSSANSFTAGFLDLQIDCDGDIVFSPQSEPFPLIFDYLPAGNKHIEPGDEGQVTLSLHMLQGSLPADMWMEIRQLKNFDGLDPNLESETRPGDDHISDNIFNKLWIDDGDKIYEDGEEVILEGTHTLDDLFALGEIPIRYNAKSNETYYVGWSWVFPSSVGNELQGDYCTFDIVFGADQVTKYALTASWTGQGSVSGVGSYDPGTVVPVTAVPATGWRFVDWTEGGLNPKDVVMDGPKHVTANFAINQYTISFNSNGGSSVADIIQDYGTTVSAPTPPTRTGYDFAGWFSDAGLITAYTFTTMPAANTTIYAKWTINSFAVTFDSQGGSAVGGQTVNYGGLVTEPSAPTRDNYGFGGWYKEAGCTNAWTFASDTISGVTILYAKWTINSFAVTFDSQGGSAVGGQTVNYGGLVTEPSAPTRDNYGFGGWYKEAGCTNAWTFASDTISEVTILYAKWTINSFAVTFDSQGGSAVGGQTVNYGGLVTEPSAPTRDNYGFGGWYKEAGCTNAWTFASDTVSEVTILYAKWTISQYTVTFNKNGGDTEANPTTRTTVPGGTVTLPTPPTKTGYNFASWNTMSNGSGSVFTASTVVSGNITVYAQYAIFAIGDSYISSAYGWGGLVDETNDNFGSEATMGIGNNFNGWVGGEVQYSLVQFAIPSPPAGMAVQSAKLSLYKDSGNAGDVSVYRITSAWTEGGVTWDNPPTVAGVGPTVSVGSTNTWYEWDVTADVQAGNANNGWELRRSVAGDSIYFQTRENTNAPQLVITYVLDSTAPTLSTVGIASNNTNTSWARVGNIVTLSFTSSENIQTPTVTVTGDPASVSGSGASWSATYTMVSGDTAGVVPFSITFSDLAGNAGTAVTSTTNGSSVTFDKTVPTLTPVGIASNNANTSWARVGNIVTLSFTSSENIQTPTVTVTGDPASVSGSGASWSATYTMVSGDTAGVVPFSIAFSDLAGNAGTAVTATTNGSSVTFDKTAPTISISAPSASITKTGPVTYTVTYADANFGSSTLAVGNITLNKTGTADASVGLSGSGTSYTVTLSSIAGDGTLGISIAAGTASDLAGNTALAAGPSTTFAVDNTALTISIGAPSVSVTKSGPVTYTVTYTDANFNSSILAVGHITLNRTGTADGTVGVSAGSGATRTVTISSITGDGTLGISIAAGTASDLVGNSAPTAGPSTTFNVVSTFISTTTGGNWNVTGTWVGGAVPGAGDAVTIATTGGNSVQISADLTQTAAGSVTINNGAILNMTTTGVDVTLGALTINGGGTCTAYRQLTVLGATSITGTINFGSTSNSVRNMTFAGAVTLNSGAVWNENPTIPDRAAATFDFSNSLTNNATTFTAQNTAHDFNGSGMTIGGSTATVIPAATFTGAYTNSGTLNVGTLTVTGAAIRLTNNGTIAVTTALSGTGGVTQGATGVLNIGGTSAITTLTATAAGNNVNYNGAAQTAKVTTYHNLTLSGSGAKAFASTPTVNGKLSMQGTATVTVSGGSMTYGSAATLEYNTATPRTTSSEEWITPFAATGGVIIANTGTITLNAAKVINAPLAVNSGARLSLPNGTTSSAASLSLGGVPQVAGSWGGTGSGATNINPTYFAATTGRLNVAAGPVAKLAFSQQPTNTAAGATITPAVTVTVQDAGGNTVTTSTASIVLAIGSNPGSGTLSGTLARSASSGVATFDDLSINNAGTGYTLTSASTDLTSATSTPFNVNLSRSLYPVGNDLSQTNDRSSGSDYFLDSTEVANFNAIDVNMWTSRSDWPSTLSTSNYLNFVFSPSLVGTTLDSAQLTFVWQRQTNVDEARIRIYNGTTWSGYYTITPMPTAGSDSTVTLDLTSYGVDTIARVNSMVIQFQGARTSTSSNRKTLHNLVQVDVTYH